MVAEAKAMVKMAEKADAKAKMLEKCLLAVRMFV